MVDTVGWVNRRKLRTGEPHSIDIYTWKLPKTWVEYGWVSRIIQCIYIYMIWCVYVNVYYIYIFRHVWGHTEHLGICLWQAARSLWLDHGPYCTVRPSALFWWTICSCLSHTQRHSILCVCIIKRFIYLHCIYGMSIDGTMVCCLLWFIHTQMLHVWNI